MELELSEGQERLARLQEEVRMSVNQQVPARPRPRTGSDPFEGTSRAVAGGPDHSASGQETGHWTAGVLASGWSWSNSVDAQVGAQRRDNLVAGPPSGLSRSLGTRRFEKSPRVVQADVRGSRPFVGVAPNPTIYRGEHGRVVRVVVHRCGLLGFRVGEASNPGPVQTRQARRLEKSNPIGSRGVRNTQVEVSSDEERGPQDDG